MIVLEFPIQWLYGGFCDLVPVTYYSVMQSTSYQTVRTVSIFAGKKQTAYM